MRKLFALSLFAAALSAAPGPFIVYYLSDAGNGAPTWERFSITVVSADELPAELDACRSTYNVCVAATGAR